jgi:hypothetical protein
MYLLKNQHKNILTADSKDTERISEGKGGWADGGRQKGTIEADGNKKDAGDH